MRMIAVAFSAILALGAAGTAQAAMGVLVEGQQLNLPLDEAEGGPILKVRIEKATMKGIFVWGERGADRKARADRIVLNGPEGRGVVKFVRALADSYRDRALAEAQPKGASLSLVFVDELKLDGGALFGDALKAGFTLGAATSATIQQNFVTHAELTVEGTDGARKTYACDATEVGRTPRFPPTDGSPPDTGEYERMYEVGRRACLEQLLAQLDGKAPPAAPTPAAEKVAVR